MEKQHETGAKPLVNKKRNIRTLFRNTHRELSFFFAGVILIYAISGITFNHLKDFNPTYVIKTKTYQLNRDLPLESVDVAEAKTIVAKLGVNETYIKHYSPKKGVVKVFLSDRASLELNLDNGSVQYEGLKKRPVFSQLAFLHYNPNVWWTWFSDLFAGSLIVICITGLAMIKGKKGFWGRGGIQFLIGISIPLLFLLLA